MNILIIQNTPYHFETGLSIHYILKDIKDTNIIWYRINKLKDATKQMELLKQNNIVTCKSINDLPYQIDFAIAITAYPFPNAFHIPAINDAIFKHIPLNKCIYVSHRINGLKKLLINNPITNGNNVLCLSPIAYKERVRFLNFTDYTTNKIKYHPIKDKLYITIQGHFELQNRDFKLLDLLDNEKYKHRFHFNILGTKSEHVYAYIQSLGYDVTLYQSVSEQKFYDVLQNHTHFIFPMINQFSRRNTYANERYSSNFNHAYGSEKPIFCNEYFKDIYDIPGIYYDRFNFADKYDDLSNLDDEKYAALIGKFNLSKKKWRLHNKKVIKKLIDYIF